MKERDQLRGRVVGTTLSGSNVDAAVLSSLLADCALVRQPHLQDQAERIPAMT